MKGWRVALFVALTLTVACVQEGDIAGCGEEDVPVLAADSDLDVATSCPAPPDFSYEGVEYTLLCEMVPPSHVGRVLVNDGGETDFEGARAIVGIPPDHGLILEGDICEKRTAVGLSNDLTDEEWGRLRGWGDRKKRRTRWRAGDSSCRRGC